MLRLFENRDCMEGMAEYPDKFFDLAIVDPPYGRKAKITNGGTWAAKRQKGGFRWDEKPDREYFNQLLRISKNQIVLGGNNFSQSLPESNGWIIWDKIINGFTAVVPEIAWSSFDKSCKIFRYPHGEGRGFRNKDYGNIHPTEKPTALYLWLLENYAKPGDKILDTHVGSASSLIACEALGFEYVGYEIDKDYYEAAKKRLETWRSLPLFDEKKAEESNQLDLAI